MNIYGLVFSGLFLLKFCTGDRLNYTRFSNTRVYKVDVNNEVHLAEMNKLVANMQVEVLNAFDENNSYEVAIGPNHQHEFEERLKAHQIPFIIRIGNLMQTLKLRKSIPQEPEMEWTQYHPVEHILKWLEYKATQHPSTTSLFTIGHTYEGRLIQGLKISRRPGNKAVFAECNMHAIEWISSAACTCFLNNLLNSRELKVQRLARNYDWIIVPVMNPDGLAFTHDVFPLWRKNRKPNGSWLPLGTCIGTDLNRNFNFHWKTVGFNVDVPCSHLYAGMKAESEPEVQALRDYISSQHDGYIRMFLSVHSYGNKLLLPYSHTTEFLPDNYEQMLNISKGFADAARVKYGTNFTYGTSAQILRPVSGSSKDWAYGVKNIRYAATIALRDEGKYGFFLPPKQIVEVCDELTDGFVGLVQAAQMEKIFD